MSRRLWLILLGLAVVAGLVHGARLLLREAPRQHTDREEIVVGNAIAELVRQQVPQGEAVTVLYLFAQGVPPYDARAKALRESLAGHAGEVHEVWAREEGHYSDEDYSRSLEEALTRHPAARALVVVSTGTVTHARPGKTLQRFLQDGRRLVLVGDTHQGTPLVKLAEQGHATILARRTAWLKQAPPAPALATAAPYVREMFTLIPATGPEPRSP
jgi:hypothetical protein